MRRVLVPVVLAALCLGASAPKADAAERKALDITKEYKTGFTGFSEDDVFAVEGRVTRVELTFEKEGPISGGCSEVLPRKNGEIRVHRYLDLFSRLKYHLVVYVE